MSKFLPFHKEIEEVTGTDLKILKKVSEGIFIDYKWKGITLEKLSKSISSFANTEGGWLFLGIKESKAGDKVAEEFSGFNLNKISTLWQQIDQANSAHISPIVTIKKKIIKGPNKTLGLEKGKGIVVIYIPKGINTPYIHSSGKIFLRNGEQSEPLDYLKHRHELDLLNKRKQNREKELKQFLTQKDFLSDNQKAHLSYLKIFFVKNLFPPESETTKISFSQFKEIMETEGSTMDGVLFDNFQTSHESFVARHIFQNDPNLMSGTWHYKFNKTATFLLPFSSCRFETPEDIFRFLKGYDEAQKFYDLCRKTGLKSGWLVDLNQLFLILVSVVGKFERLLEAEGIKGTYYFKFKGVNFGNRIPFLATPTYQNFINENGIPKILFNDFLFPKHYGYTSFLETFDENDPLFVNKKNGEGKKSLVFCNALLFLEFIQDALGLPKEIFGGFNKFPGKSKFERTIGEYLEANEKFRKANEKREKILDDILE